MSYVLCLWSPQDNICGGSPSLWIADRTLSLTSSATVCTFLNMQNSLWRGLSFFHLWGKLKNLTISLRNCPTFAASSSGGPVRELWCVIVSHYSDWRLDQFLCPWDHYPVIRILVLHSDRLLLTDACNSSHRLETLVASEPLDKVIWLDQCNF